MGLPVDDPDTGSIAYEPNLDGCKKPLQRQQSDGFQKLIEALSQCTEEEDDSYHTSLKKFLSGFIESYSSATHHQENDVHLSKTLAKLLTNLPEKADLITKIQIETNQNGEETQKEGVNQETEGKCDEKGAELVAQQVAEMVTKWLEAAENLKAGSVGQKEWEESGKVPVVQEEAAEKWLEVRVESEKLFPKDGKANQRVELAEVHVVQEEAAKKWEESEKVYQEPAGKAIEEVESGNVFVAKEEAAEKWAEKGAEEENVVQEKAGEVSEEVAPPNVHVVKEKAAEKWEEGEESEKVYQEPAGKAIEEVESGNIFVTKEEAAEKWAEKGAEEEKVVQEKAGEVSEEVVSPNVHVVEGKAAEKLEEQWAESEKLVQREGQEAGATIAEKESKSQQEGQKDGKEECGEVVKADTKTWEKEQHQEEQKQTKETGTHTVGEENQASKTKRKGRKKKRKGRNKNRNLCGEVDTTEATSGQLKDDEQINLHLDLKDAEENLGATKTKGKGRNKKENLYRDVNTAEAPTGQQKDFSKTEAVLKNASMRIKTAADQGNGDDRKKAGQAKPNDGGKSQTSTRARAGGGRGGTATPSNAGDDDDDDDHGRKPRPNDPTEKKQGCNSPACKQKKPGEPGSPSLKPSGRKDMRWKSQGARPKTRPHTGPGGDEGSEGHVKVLPESKSEQKLWQLMKHMSLGTDGNRPRVARYHKCIITHLSEVLSPAGKLMPRTRQNHQAFVKMYHDDGIRAHRDVALSMPSGLRWRGASAMPGDLHVAVSAEVSPRSVEAQVAEDARADEVPQPPEVPQAIEIPPGVSHGEPRHLMVFADRVHQLKDHDSAELLGQHQGVLLDEDLKPVHGQYREGQQYAKLRCVGKGAFGDVYLMRDRTSGKEVVGKRVSVKDFAASEAVLWCPLDHPGVLRFLGLLLTDDWVIFLSSYQPGSQTLQRLIDQSVLGQGRALLITQQILEALVYLHSHIVHKDIKPHNILILPGDRVQLIDFGLATRLTTSQHAEQPKGTDCYMAPEIAESRPYDARVDIWSLGCTLVCMISRHPPWSQRFKGIPLKIFLIATNEPPLEDIPPNTDPKVRRFIEQTLKKDFKERPTAGQALEILPIDVASELYNTLAIEQDEPEPEPMDVQRDIPADVFPGPLTPWTPKGPQDGFCLFPQRQDPPPAKHPAPAMSLSFLYIPSDIEPRQDKQIEIDDDEDMYGPPVDTDPETFVEGALEHRPSEVPSGTSSVGPRNVARQPSLNAANFDPQFNSRLSDEQRNSLAKSSFMQDSTGIPLGLSGDSQSFELEPMSLGGSMEECLSIGTAHALMLEAGQMPSVEGAPRDQPDIRGAIGFAAGTSGVASNSPGHSAEDHHFASLTETIQSTSTAVSGGIVAVVSIEGMEPFRMRLNPDYSGRDLAGAIVGLPQYMDSKLAMKAFTLCWKDTGDVLYLNHTFGCGEHQLVAVAAPEGDDWPRWRIDNSGWITQAE